jgi:hypothetical protein
VAAGPPDPASQSVPNGGYMRTGWDRSDFAEVMACAQLWRSRREGRSERSGRLPNLMPRNESGRAQ